ncbi:hypothetical protein ElyMa_006119400 [Elysia marginata]|uniref:Uncharacterized protein n=1 Tax=Elysia marginata TaxID=1093978 RepID=A0AAV4GVB4_9GAST|nr:hypothetical protein ElyMa_006119400 [Elysia marginata]
MIFSAAKWYKKTKKPKLSSGFSNSISRAPFIITPEPVLVPCVTDASVDTSDLWFDPELVGVSLSETIPNLNRPEMYPYSTGPSSPYLAGQRSANLYSPRGRS